MPNNNCKYVGLVQADTGNNLMPMPPNELFPNRILKIAHTSTLLTYR